jgi:starvation-inducible DNA-binding protein
MKTSKNNQDSSVTAMNHLLAAFTVTAQNARFCHWNVVGPLFEDNHEFFGDLYDYLADTTDIFAERIRALGAFPMSKLADYLKETKLTEYSLPMNAANMQTNILKDLVHISTEMGKLAEEVESDLVTQDIIVSEKQVIDKKAWMLRAMLGK